MLDSLLRCLTPRERRVVRLRFEQDMTQTRIAEEIGISQMQVSRILRRALERLRHVLAADDAARDVARDLVRAA